MKNLTYLLISFLSTTTFTQTNYTVNAQATTWMSSNLSIEVGDSVTWINNNQGSHNINGTQESFPMNLESFGMLTVGTNWTYGYRFNTIGIYNYRCDVHPGTMVGKVTVNDQLSTNEEEAIAFSFYPNPANEIICIHSPWNEYMVEIDDLMGTKVLTRNLENEEILDISNLRYGMYFIQISSETGTYQQRLVKN